MPAFLRECAGFPIIPPTSASFSFFEIITASLCFDAKPENNVEYQYFLRNRDLLFPQPARAPPARHGTKLPPGSAPRIAALSQPPARQPRQRVHEDKVCRRRSAPLAAQAASRYVRCLQTAISRNSASCACYLEPLSR